MENREDFEYEGCEVKIYRKNGKVAVLIEHSKPVGLIVLASLIHILGEPINHCYEEGDAFVLFLFNDKQPDIDMAKWKEVFEVAEAHKVGT